MSNGVITPFNGRYHHTSFPYIYSIGTVLSKPASGQMITAIQWDDKKK